MGAGFELSFTNEEAFDLVVAVAQSRMELNEIAEILREHVR